MIASLVRSSTFSGLASVLSYALTIYLARNESQLAFAEFTYSLAWALIITQVVDLAATQCLTHFKISSKQNLETILSSVYAAKFSALFACFLVLVFLNAALGVNVPFTSFFFIGPAFYLGPVFEMRARNVSFAKLLFVEKASILLFCYVYLQFNELDRFIYAAFLTVSIASIVFQTYLLDLRLPAFQAFDRAILKRYFGRYWSIYLTLASQVGYGHVSRIIIEAKLGMIVFVSVSLALQIVNALAIVQTQVDRHLRPRISEMVEDSNAQAAKALSLRYLSSYLLPLFLGCMVLYVFAADVMVFLFGQKWLAASEYLKYLLPLILTVAILRFMDMFVVAYGVGKANLVINSLAALVLVGLLLLIPDSQDVHVYLLTIVGVQIVHIVLVGWYLVRHHTRVSTAKSREAG